MKVEGRELLGPVSELVADSSFAPGLGSQWLPPGLRATLSPGQGPSPPDRCLLT